MGVYRLDGKVAIVTASTEGIGLAIPQRLAKEGVKVVVSSRKEVKVQQAVDLIRKEGGEAIGVPCNVGVPEQRSKLINETVDKYGGIDLLVCNAGINPAFGQILDTPEWAWDKIFDTNVKATFLLIKEAIPHMDKRGKGSIVIVGSHGGYQPSAVLGAYSVSKTALLGLTKALSYQLATSNIRVNCISPGLIKTRMSSALWKNEKIANRVVSSSALKRIGQPEECAGVAAFLLSDDASYMTGESIVINGGEHARL